MTPRSLSPGRLALILPAALLGGIAAGVGLRLSGAGGNAAGGAANGREKGEGGNSAPVPLPFSMERFRAAQGLEMHRMLAKVLPGADAALVRALADDLVEREPRTHHSPVWTAVMTRWLRLSAPDALSWARAADDPAGAAASGGPPPASKGPARPEASEGRPLTLTTLREWAGQDADGAIAAIRNGDAEEWGVVLEILSETDPGRALTLSGTLDPPDGPFQTSRHISNEDDLLARWAARDPQASLAFVMAKKPEDRDELLDSLAGGWALKDAAACGEWIAALGGAQKKTAIGGLPLAAKENPAGVARILNTLPLDAASREAGRELAAAWAEKSPQEALTWLRGRFPEGSQRAGALAAVASTVMGTDLPAAMRIMDEMGWRPWSLEELGGTKVISPGQEGDRISFNAEEVSGRDPFAAVFGSIHSPESVMRRLLDRLGHEDPALGIRCFEKAPAASRDLLLQGFAPAWFQRDPEAAMRWLAAMPSTQVAADRMAIILEKIPELTPSAMRDWALRLPAGPLSEALAAKSFTDTPVRDPITALRELPFTDPASRDAAAKVILSRWAESAPREAAENMVTGPDPSTGFLGSAVQNWTNHDPAAASAWTASLPPGPSRDTAIGGLISSLSDPQRDPDLPSALVWSLDLSDPVRRLKSAEDLVAALLLSTPESALPGIRETLNSAGTLSNTDRQTLLELIPP